MTVLRPVFAAAILALLAGPVSAQERYATVDVRAGYTLFSGQAKDTLKGQSSFGAGAAIALGQRLHLGISVDWAHHSRKQTDPSKCPATVPPAVAGCVIGGSGDEQWNIVHAFLKATYNIVATEKWTVGLNAGPGIMVFSPNKVLRDANGLTSDAHFAGNVGTNIAFWFTERIGLLASVQADFALKKTSGQIFRNSTALAVPITGGFQFKI